MEKSKVKHMRAATLALTLAMTWLPAHAQSGDDRAVSIGGGASSGMIGSASDTGAEMVPAGTPFVGGDVVTAQSLEAVGAVVVPEAAAPDELHPDLLARMGDSTESIINWDSRMRHHTTDYPNRAIVYITYQGRHLCTGFLVSRDTVVTSGHCLHTGGSRGSWRDRRQMSVFAGRDGTASPHGSCGVTRMHSVRGWTRKGKSTHDYGAMRLDCNIGSTVGWFGVYKPSRRDLRNTPATVAGYPGDKQQMQYGSSDKIREKTRRNLCYRADTTGGNSGGPVFHDRDKALYNTGTWAFGVHGYGVGLSACGGRSGNMNGAVRVNGPVLRNIVKWINR